jgi:hypothetical protein
MRGGDKIARRRLAMPGRRGFLSTGAQKTRVGWPVQ